MNKLFISIVLLFIIVLSSSSHVFSQRDTGSTTVITFEDESSFNDYQPSGNLGRNIIKIDMLNILVGDFSIYYERTLNSKLGIEIGVGITKKNYLQGLWKEIFSEDEELIQYTGSYTTTYPTGSTAKIGVKFYPGSYAPEDFFFQVQYSFRQYKQEHTFNNTVNLLNSDPLPVQTIYNEFRILFGNSEFWTYSDYLMFESFFGFGLKYRFYDDVDFRETDVLNSNGDYYEEAYTTEELDLKFGLYIGWKVCYAF